MSKRMPDRMSEYMSDKMSVSISNRLQDTKSEYMANRMPGRRAEYTSDGLSVGGDHSTKVIPILSERSGKGRTKSVCQSVTHGSCWKAKQNSFWTMQNGSWSHNRMTKPCSPETDNLSEIHLTHILTFHLTVSMAFYLTEMLTFYLAVSLAMYLLPAF